MDPRLFHIVFDVAAGAASKYITYIGLQAHLEVRLDHNYSKHCKY